MLRSAKSFFGLELKASDGFIGHCRDFLFDDKPWTARYLVADTGKWLSTRLVLVSAYALNDPDLGTHVSDIPVNLTREQIEAAPGIDTDSPVSRRHELEMARFFSHPLYWQGEGLWGETGIPENLAPPSPEELDRHAQQLETIDDSHLRSVQEVIGYKVEASDGELGHVDDIIIENTTWALRYLVVDTRNWLPGRKVLISPEWATTVDWYESQVEIHLDREAIKDSPPYDPLKPVNRDYEGKLYDYYGRPVYY